MTASRPPIVVAVDGSACDADALRLGGRLAELLGAPIVVAHAHPHERIGDLLGEGEQARMLRSLAEQVGDHVAAHLPETKVLMRLLPDRSPARALHRLASADAARMIVVGASERGRVGLIRPGSTSERIIQGSPCPVVVAPAGYADSGPAAVDCIGCGFDAKSPARSALAEAVALAAAARARLRVIAAFEPIAFGHLVVAPPLDLRTVNATVRSALARQLDEAVADIREVQAEPVLVDGDAGDVLTEQARSLDLLVVGSRGYGPLRSVLLGGVSGHVIRTAHCPVMVCPADGDERDSAQQASAERDQDADAAAPS